MAERPKNYDPKEIEPRWYAEWMARGYFHADAAAPKAPFAIVIPPPERHRLAAHGARARHAPSRTSSRAGGAWRPTTPCGCPAPTTPASPPRWWSSASCSETEKKSRHDLGREAFVERVWDWREQHRRPDPRAAQAAGLLARLGARRLHDGPAVLGGGHRGLRAPARRGPDLPRASASSTGARRAGRRSPTWRSTTTRARRASCTSSPIRWPTARARWWSRPRGPRRCWATRRWPCTRTIRATRRRSARWSSTRSLDREFPIIADADPGRPEVRHRRRQGDAGARPQRLRDRPAAQPADDLDPRRGGRGQRRGRPVRRAWTASRRARR